jgi:hypothetical protein
LLQFADYLFEFDDFFGRGLQLHRVLLQVLLLLAPLKGQFFLLLSAHLLHVQLLLAVLLKLNLGLFINLPVVAACSSQLLLHFLYYFPELVLLKVS